nr:MAG TPA: hypothetical protein [Bacteriophage sp.]
MSDYINRDIAIARLTALEVQNPIATMCDAKRVLADMPEVDAVEVVRCKDCKWYVEDREFPPFCDNPICGMQHPNDETFCSYGDGRDDD